jgi:molybdopterin converting factor subunit 1
MRIRVRFFAGTRDAVGAPSLDVDVPDTARVGDLWSILAQRHPRLAAYKGSALLALDGTFAPPMTPLRAGCEVAIMPPVSGGALH